MTTAVDLSPSRDAAPRITLGLLATLALPVGALFWFQTVSSAQVVEFDALAKLPSSCALSSSPPNTPRVLMTSSLSRSMALE